MHGPMGGPHGGFHGPMGFGMHPEPFHMGFYHRPVGSSLLGLGLTAMFGSMIGNSIANKNIQSSNNNYNSNRVYEYFNYCPNCGEKRNDSSNYCSYCGRSLVK